MPFKSFAIPTIVGEIRRHFRDRAWALHVPRRLKELSLRLTDGRDSSRRARPVADDRRAGGRVGVPEDEVIEALDIANAYSTRSLSEPRFDDASDQDRTADPRKARGGIRRGRGSRVVEAGLAALDPRSRRIVELRFFDGRTQSEIAVEVGISQMHVSRLLRQLTRGSCEAGSRNTRRRSRSE